MYRKSLNFLNQILIEIRTNNNNLVFFISLRFSILIVTIIVSSTARMTHLFDYFQKQKDIYTNYVSRRALIILSMNFRLVENSNYYETSKTGD